MVLYTMRKRLFYEKFSSGSEKVFKKFTFTFSVKRAYFAILMQYSIISQVLHVVKRKEEIFFKIFPLTKN